VRRRRRRPGRSERLGQEAGLIGPDPAHEAAYFDALPDVLDRALKALPAHRYDAIVVDEGQDLDAVWCAGHRVAAPSVRERRPCCLGRAVR
jgi:hypothetical protein